MADDEQEDQDELNLDDLEDSSFDLDDLGEDLGEELGETIEENLDDDLGEALETDDEGLGDVLEGVEDGLGEVFEGLEDDTGTSLDDEIAEAEDLEAGGDEELMGVLADAAAEEEEQPEVGEAKERAQIKRPEGVFTLMLVLANILTAAAITLATVELYQYYWPKPGQSQSAPKRATPRKKASPSKKSVPKPKAKTSKAAKGDEKPKAKAPKAKAPAAKAAKAPE